MNRFFPSVCGIVLIVALAACQTAPGSIERVTAIPTGEAPTVAPSLTATPPSTTAAEAVPTEPAAATPLPLSTNLPVGNAMQIAAATDTFLNPTPRNPVSFASFPVEMAFGDFYDGYNMRTGLILSDKLVALDGELVVMEGYMAPPLKPELDYFVLTRVRLAFCPFCSTAGDWPDDIALVYLPDQTTTATTAPVRVEGRIEVGASVDAETGMVSLVRIYAERLEVLG